MEKIVAVYEYVKEHWNKVADALTAVAAAVTAIAAFAQLKLPVFVEAWKIIKPFLTGLFDLLFK